MFLLPRHRCIAPDETRFFKQNILILFLFSMKCMLWFSLEAPYRGASFEYLQHMFSRRNKKNIIWISGTMIDIEITSRKHAYKILTPLNPTFI